MLKIKPAKIQSEKPITFSTIDFLALWFLQSPIEIPQSAMRTLSYANSMRDTDSLGFAQITKKNYKLGKLIPCS